MGPVLWVSSFVKSATICCILRRTRRTKHWCTRWVEILILRVSSLLFWSSAPMFFWGYVYNLQNKVVEMFLLFHSAGIAISRRVPRAAAYTSTKLCTRLSKKPVFYQILIRSSCTYIGWINAFFSPQWIDSHLRRRNIWSNATEDWGASVPKMQPPRGSLLPGSDSTSWRRNETLLRVHESALLS